jgi:hypothetical protein
MGWMFVRIIWIPLYRNQETERFVGSQETPALQVDIERQDGKETRTWSIADQQALQKLKSGLQAAQAAPPGEPPASEQKYRLRVKRSDSRVDEYEVILGPEGRMQDRLYVVRRNGGGAPVYGSTYSTPELRSALQQVLVSPAPK